MSTGSMNGNVYGLRLLDVAFDLPSIAANTTGVATATIDNVGTEDAVFVNKPSHEAGLGIVNARVSAANTVEITAMNTTAGAINEVSETFNVLIVRGSKSS